MTKRGLEMNAHQALNKLRDSGMTLETVKQKLEKKGVRTSVATLWRILDSEEHQTSAAVADGIRELKPLNAKVLK